MLSNIRTRRAGKVYRVRTGRALNGGTAFGAAAQVAQRPAIGRTKAAQKNAKYARSEVVLLKDVFDAMDVDGNGCIDLSELQASLLGEEKRARRLSEKVALQSKAAR